MVLRMGYTQEKQIVDQILINPTVFTCAITGVHVMKKLFRKHK